MGTWMDADGLFHKFGTDKATANRGGEYKSWGTLREVEVKIDLTTLTQAEVVQSDQLFFPAGARLEEVEIEVITAAATGVAIDVGLVRTSDRTTEIDFDGILAAMTTATLSAGNKINLVKGGALVGALVGSGTSTANVGHITASATTATAFTTGLILLKIRFLVP